MNQNILDTLAKIFEIIIIPLLGVLTTFIINLINKKSKEIQVKTDNETLDKYIQITSDTIIKCVIATNQTYVNELKGKNAFDEQAQKTAFQMTFNSVMSILTDDIKNYLSIFYGDLTEYITKQIEATVNKNRI